MSSLLRLNSESTLSAFNTVDMNVNATGTYQFRYDPGATIATEGDGDRYQRYRHFLQHLCKWCDCRKAEAVASNLSDGEAVAFLDEDSKAYFFVKGASDNLLVQVGSAARYSRSLTVSSENGIKLKIH